MLDSAETILFIEEVFIELELRGHRLSLIAVDRLLVQLGLGKGCIVLLQAGPINRVGSNDNRFGVGATEAFEKIATHWRRMGFSEWSDSDDAWLCLWSEERLKIDEVVFDLPGLRLFNSDSRESCEDKLRP